MSRASLVRNPIGWRERLAGLRGEPVDFDLSGYDRSLHAIRLQLGDARIQSANLAHGLTGSAGAAQVFPHVCEAARRALGQVPFDEQIVAGLALAREAIVEVQTGEGKTLAATMPVALWALEGRGVHVLTFNDYLARRDAEWMGPVYRLLGLSVGYIQHGMSAAERRQAYAADVTYVTAKEAGFDHLRDLCAGAVDELVHRPFHAALVDEADSLLIDEARVPLVLAGSTDGEAPAPGARMAGIIAGLVDDLDFVVDEHGRNVELTDRGLATVETALDTGSLHEKGDDVVLSQVSCALHVRTLLRRDVDYLVRDGRIEMIDELTGRTVPDRRWPEGLQSALEAKEGLVPGRDGQVLASLTLQRFLRGYPRLAGMTGTAQDAAAELHQTYGRRVVVIPTHRPSRRLDLPDQVFTHRAAKERAVVAEVVRQHRVGRPVLVGTLTVQESERLGSLVGAAGVPCRVLNAAQDQAEADVVAHAGARGAVTIATNMAGRGTDIRLGGADASQHDAVAALGGLLVIGTSRHESRRVDRQLRGRAARQGDPGETRFFVSLEDDLLVRHGGLERLLPAALVPARQEDALESPVVRREIARAQRVIEGQHWDVRRTLARYAAVVEDQFAAVVAERRELLDGRGDLEDRVRLRAIDQEWRRHLAHCAELREGAHLARLGGRVPLQVFTAGVLASFEGFGEAVDARVGAADGPGAIPPASATTWTYLVNDDPFRHTMGTLLTGAGGPTIAIYAAVLLSPLFLAWAAVDRWRRKKRTGAPR